MNSVTVNHFINQLRSAYETGDENAAAKTIEAANVELVQKLYRTVTAGDFEGFLASLAEDVEFENIGPSVIPFSGRWRGRSEVGAATKRNFAVVEDQCPEVLTLVAQGDTVIIVAREQGRIRSTGRKYDMHWVQMFTLRNGQVVRFRQIFDSAVMVGALSAPESLDPSTQPAQ